MSNPPKRPRLSDSSFSKPKTQIPNGWSVHKFGGSSLTSANCYRNVYNLILDEILQEPTKRICVVISAMGAKKASVRECNKLTTTETSSPRVSMKPSLDQTIVSRKVTDMILRCFSLAAKQDESYMEIFKIIKDKHMAVVDDLFADQADVMENVKRLLCHHFEDMRLSARNMWLGRYVPPDHWAFGFGELWSTCLMSTYLNVKLTDRKAVFMDGRDVIHIFPNCDVINMDAVTSLQKLRLWYSQHITKDSNDVIVVTGYLASDSTGKPTTLGRAGSDYSAAIMANLLKADSLTMWTDVDGVYSADPNIVKGAQLQESLSYREASELVHFGVKVMHPKTMSPIINQKIPIWVKNSYNPKKIGTCIESVSHKSTGKSSLYGVVGFSYIPDLRLVSISGCGLISVPGVASRFFEALNQKSVDVVLICQSGSKHSICCAVPGAQADDCVEALCHEFRDELQSTTVQTVEKNEDICACLAVVGDAMKRKKGIAGRMFCALGNANVNIMAIAQGRTERNISTIVRQVDAKKGLMAVHKAFFDEPMKKIVSPHWENSTSPVSNSADPDPLIINNEHKVDDSNQEESNLQTKYKEIKEKIRKLTEEAKDIAGLLNGKKAD